MRIFGIFPPLKLLIWNNTPHKRKLLEKELQFIYGEHCTRPIASINWLPKSVFLQILQIGFSVTNFYPITWSMDNEQSAHIYMWINKRFQQHKSMLNAMLYETWDTSVSHKTTLTLLRFDATFHLFYIRCKLSFAHMRPYVERQQVERYIAL